MVSIRIPKSLFLKPLTSLEFVFRFCASLDSKLQATVEDSKYFVSESNDKNSGHSRVSSLGTKKDLGFLADNKTNDDSKGLFNRFGDAEEIQKFLQETCFDHVNQ